jgi:DNA-binding beta-propeller fold protein YncE
MMHLVQKQSNKLVFKHQPVRVFFLGLAFLLLPILATAKGAIQHKFDLTHAGASPLVLPSDVAVAPNGNIYIVDGGNHRVVVYDSDGTYLKIIGGKGSDAGLFSGPMGITIDQKARIYVADTNNHRIQIFKSNGEFLRQFPIKLKGKKIRPIDIAVSPSGDKVYVTGNTNHKVMVYSLTYTLSGVHLTNWGGNGTNPGEFRYPATIAVNPQGNVYVVDVLNSRVQQFDEKGKLLTMVGKWGVMPGQLFRPKGVAIDRQNNVYVSDSYLEVIQVFDSDSRFSHVLGSISKPKKFISPGGIAVDKANRLYVAEMLGNKVSVYDVIK